MRFFFLAGVLLALHSHAQVSKPVIDTAVFAHWPEISGSSTINSTGKYVFYKEGQGESWSTVIKSTFDNWSKTFLCNVECIFTRDGKRIIFQQHDTLFLLQLGSDHYTFKAGVNSFQDVSSLDNEWIVYQQTGSDDITALHIINTGTEKEQVIKGSIGYYFYPKSNSLLLVRDERSFSWYDLLKSREETGFKWKGNSFTMTADITADHFCFMVKDTVDQNNQLFYYRRGMSAPIVLTDDKTIAKADAGVELSDERPVFNKNGRFIIFQVKVKNTQIQSNNNGNYKSKLIVWKYSDRKTPAEQPYDYVNEYRWSVSLTTQKVIALEDELTKLKMDPRQIGDYAIRKNRKEWIWWQKSADVYSLISLKDGSKKIINDNVNYNTILFLSPDDKYVVYFNPLADNYFSFTIEDGSTKNVTSSVHTQWYIKEPTGSANIPSCVYGCGVAAWLRDESSVLLYDQYDIWKIDLKGEKKPVNCTGYYGAKKHIIFRTVEFISREGAFLDNPHLLLSSKDDVLLCAVDSATKATGFCTKKLLGEDHSFPLPTLGPYSYVQQYYPLTVQKAASANIWVVVRGSAVAARNVFVTQDFSFFKQISNLAPEKNYNWLTSELITWQLPDGQYNQGILYKPENFDSTKKYPVLFNYYEQRTQELNEYKTPEYFGANINVPWFVSRGYLVFIPDIHYTIGQTGESAAAALVSAGKYLSQFHWVDGSKMGIQGHSFGGFETIYTITHSHLFAAACEAAGVSDIVSGYGGIYQHGPVPFLLQDAYYERGQGRMGASLPEASDLYVKNNPVLKTAEVTTPLLMMNGKMDAAVSFTQAMELFTGLRRMGKKVWLLEYPNAGHTLVDNDAKDYTIRVTQFFDHYLKGAPLPKWMAEGQNNGYELDPNANEPEQKEVLYKGKIQKVNAQENDY